MIKVLFVCLGNICRSPSAEAIFDSIVAEKEQSDSFEIDSAGTSGHHTGQLSDPRMRETALEYNIQITSRSRQFDYSDFHHFNYIIVMDDSNLQDIVSLDSKNQFHKKIHKMTDFGQGIEDEFIPDPYYGGEEGFHNVVRLLSKCCEGLYSHIIKNHTSL